MFYQIFRQTSDHDTRRGIDTNVEPALLVALKSVHHLNENRGCSQKPQRSEQTKRKLFFLWSSTFDVET